MEGPPQILSSLHLALLWLPGLERELHFRWNFEEQFLEFHLSTHGFKIWSKKMDGWHSCSDLWPGCQMSDVSEGNFFFVSEDNYWSQYFPRSFTELLLRKFTVGWLVPYIITQEFEAYCFHKQKSQKLGSCSHQDLYRFSNAVSHSLTKHRNSQKLTPMCTKSPLMQAIFVTGFVTQKHMAKCDTLT